MNKLAFRINVIMAVILRDVRTRFGRSHLGYLVAIAWPLTHLTAMVVFMGVLRNTTPIGTDSAVFIATGIMPYVLCLYPARLTAYAIEANKSLFIFPVVRALDLIISRALIEFLTAFIVVILFFVGAAILGENLLPMDLERGASAVLATVFFAISVGVFNTVICSVVRFWHVGFALMMILFYLTSGIFVLPTSLPEEMKYYMWFNPLVHCVEWLRSAYYEGYGEDMLSRQYLMWVSLTCLFLGLTGERFIRGKLLSS